jgi:hypothetical protein
MTTTTNNGRVSTPAPAGQPDKLAARTAALQAASMFAAAVMLSSDKAPSSGDVVRVAEAFERWLLRP